MEMSPLKSLPECFSPLYHYSLPPIPLTPTLLPKRDSAAAGGFGDFGFVVVGGSCVWMCVAAPLYTAIIGSILLLLCGSPNLNTTPLIGYTPKEGKKSE